MPVSLLQLVFSILSTTCSKAPAVDCRTSARTCVVSLSHLPVVLFGLRGAGRCIEEPLETRERAFVSGMSRIHLACTSLLRSGVSRPHYCCLVHCCNCARSRARAIHIHLRVPSACNTRARSLLFHASGLKEARPVSARVYTRSGAFLPCPAGLDDTPKTINNTTNRHHNDPSGAIQRAAKGICIVHCLLPPPHPTETSLATRKTTRCASAGSALALVPT